MARQINCSGCGKYLGEIRDAKLAKGIDYRCSACARADNLKKGDVSDFMDSLFKYRRQTK